MSWRGLFSKAIIVKGMRSCVMVVTYVDDLLLTGVRQIPGLMEALQAAIEMETPHPINKYLGAVHRMSRRLQRIPRTPKW